jgi:hypothetical protein
MSSHKVVIDDVTLVRSRDAARECGVSFDYVSRLAPAGLVAGQLHNGLWFVDCASLKEFLAEQDRQKQIWRARQAELRREDSSSTTTTNSGKNIRSRFSTASYQVQTK